MKKITLIVSDMHCVNCAITLQTLEDDLPGVKQVESSYRTGKMSIVFEETLLTPEIIIEKVKNLGYTATL